MWEFTFRDGTSYTAVLAWEYVPYVEDFRKWLFETYESTYDLRGLSIEDLFNQFFSTPSIKYENRKRPIHPILWVKRRVSAWLLGPDDEDDDEDEDFEFDYDFDFDEDEYDRSLE